MSEFLDIADAIKARLEEGTELDGVGIIVDRQKDILVEIAKGLKGITGATVVILFAGFTNLDQNSSTPRLGTRYVIDVWSKPVLTEGMMPADEVLALIIKRLHHWIPAANGTHAFDEANVTGGDMVPDKSYLRYDCEVTVPIMLL